MISTIRILNWNSCIGRKTLSSVRAKIALMIRTQFQAIHKIFFEIHGIVIAERVRKCVRNMHTELWRNGTVLETGKRNISEGTFGP